LQAWGEKARRDADFGRVVWALKGQNRFWPGMADSGMANLGRADLGRGERWRLLLPGASGPRLRR